MQRIFLGKPYQFVPPDFGGFLPMTVPSIFPAYLQFTAGIQSIDFIGREHLERSLQNGSRIVLASNHSRPSDPMLLAVLARKIKQPFHYLTNWHAFLESKAQAWIIRKLGGFSICREGTDRKALRAAGELLVLGKRPLVIFPEGEVSRTNDFLCPFMRGISFVVKVAMEKLTDLNPSPKIVIHPIAIKYTLTKDVERDLHLALDRIEDRFRWKKNKSPLLARIARVGKNLLALKELEHLGCVQEGETARRIDRLKEQLLAGVEEKWFSGKSHASFMNRVNSLRGAILKQIADGKSQIQSEKQALDNIDLAVRLSNYPCDYLRENPTLERMAETVQRLEEDALGRVRSLGRWKARVKVGEPIHVNAEITIMSQLTEQLRDRIRFMLDAASNAVSNGRTSPTPA